MVVLRKTTFINGQVFREYRTLFLEIAKRLEMNIDDLRNKYMSNIENMLRVKGEHEIANTLYS